MILIPSFRVIFAVHNVCMYSVYAIYTHRELQREHTVRCVQVFCMFYAYFVSSFELLGYLTYQLQTTAATAKQYMCCVPIELLTHLRRAYVTLNEPWSVYECGYFGFLSGTRWTNCIRVKIQCMTTLSHTQLQTLWHIDVWVFVYLCICACVSYEMSNLATNIFIHVKQMYTFMFFYFSFPFDIHMRIALMTNTNCNRLLIRWVCRERLPRQTINYFVGFWIFFIDTYYKNHSTV